MTAAIDFVANVVAINIVLTWIVGICILIGIGVCVVYTAIKYFRRKYK